VSEPWGPLSARENAACLDLYEEVPASLEAAPREWIYVAVYKLGDNGRRLMIKLELVLPQDNFDAYRRAYADCEEKLRLHRETLAEKVNAEETSRPTAAPVILTCQLKVMPPPSLPRPNPTTIW